jgi:tripartite-type tricarboxylate transporter receptor subunit TctC
MVQISAVRAGGVGRSRRSDTKFGFGGGVMPDSWFRLNTIAALALSICAIAATASLAQEWPTHAVRWVLPFGPGSGADTAARLITDTLQQKWGQPIVIDGKPGGDGLLSLQTVVSAKDDHTLFFGPSSIFVVQRYVHEDMSFDPETDLAPIAGVAKVQIAIAVPTSLGISTLAEFVALARAKPSETSYAVAPGFSEFVFDAFVKENGLAIAKVPYRDITKSPVDLGENRIQLCMQSYAAMRTYAQTGKIKIIAINDRERSPIAMDVPSVVEAGFPSLLASPVLGLLGPRDMPVDLRRRIAADMLAALDDKTVGERLALVGQPATPMGVDAFTAALKEQYAQVAHIAAVLGIAKK